MRGSRRRAWSVLLVLLAAWLLVGALRAPGVASGYLAGLNAGTRDVRVEAAFPVVPPFWVVSVSGQVPVSSGQSYHSAMILLIEPITGTVVRWASG